MALAQITIRRGTTAEWAAANPVLGDGEMGYDSTLKRVKVGDGASSWVGLGWSTMAPGEVQSVLDAATIIDQADTPTDASVANLITTPGSQTSTQLFTAIVGGLSDPASDIGAAGRSMIADGFTNRTSSFANPEFTRANGGAPVFTRAGSPFASDFNSLYWPCVVDARAMFGASALDEFYLYASSNHEPIHNKSGVALFSGPTELGPWTYRGRVYRDDVSGQQTETPTVFADPTREYKAIMLYQQENVAGAVGGQTTMWAVSNDGVNWTRGGIAIDIPSDWPSDGHTGYVHVVRIGDKLFAHGLAGGYSWPMWAISESTDGRRWRMQREPLSAGTDIIGESGRRIEWNMTNIVPWRGRAWWIGLTNKQPTWESPRDCRIAVAPISDDLRSLSARPEVQLYPPQGAENVQYHSVFAFVGRDARLYLYYQVDNSFYAGVVN